MENRGDGVVLLEFPFSVTEWTMNINEAKNLRNALSAAIQRAEAGKEGAAVRAENACSICGSVCNECGELIPSLPTSAGLLSRHHALHCSLYDCNEP